MKKLKLVTFILLGIILMSIPLLGACEEEEEEVTPTTPEAPTEPEAPTTPEAATEPEAPTGPEAPATPETPTTPETKVAKPEGTFTFGADSLGTEGFLPWIAHQADLTIFGAVYDTIAIQTYAGSKIPSVAESWEWSEDYTDLTLHIREGIQFHDGWGELTAEDVAYSIEQHRSEESTSLVLSYNTILESIDIIDPYTLVIHQSVPNVDFPEMYIFGSIGGAIVCKDYVETVGIEEANINPIGSGPYKLVEHKVGNYIKYEAVEDHWRVIPEFKYLVIKAIPEESTRIAMLKTGDIDATMISAMSIADLPEEEFTIDYWLSGPNTVICFGGLARPVCPIYKEGYHNQDPWVDIRVREAMNIAIDRDAINHALHHDTAKPMNLTRFMPGMDDLEPIPYDPERAKELLAEAGYPDGFSLTLVSAPDHPGVPMSPKESEAVAGYWDEIGIKVDIQILDFPSYWPKVEKSENAGEVYDFRLAYPGVNLYTHLMMLKADDNLWGGRFQVPELDVLWPMAEEGLAEFDLEKRDTIYREIARVERESWLGVPLMQVPIIIAKNKEKIGNWPPNFGTYYFNFEYIQYAQPLNTFRLFEIDVD